KRFSASLIVVIRLKHRFDFVDATTASNIDVFNRHPASWSANTGLYPIEADLIKRYFPAPPARVLDIGCGAGRTTVELAQKGYIVKAIDLAPALLAVVRQRAPESSPEIMNATELAFPEATFDAVIFSFNGIDCVFPQSDRLKVFAEVRRVLRPGGVFYYSSHNGIGHVGRACVSMSLSMWLRSTRSRNGLRPGLRSRSPQSVPANQCQAEQAHMVLSAHSIRCLCLKLGSARRRRASAGGSPAGEVTRGRQV